jgi:hypothetical protein
VRASRVVSSVNCCWRNRRIAKMIGNAPVKIAIEAAVLVGMR